MHLKHGLMGPSRKILRASWTAKKTNEWVLDEAGVKRKLLHTVKARKLEDHEERKELPGKRDNARNNAMQARKTTHGLGGQHQLRRGQDSPWKSQNDRGQR